MSVLRVYLPAECDEHGVPLDWERCRTCEGTGKPVKLMKQVGGGPARIASVDEFRATFGRDPACPTCDRHGSLKAAALVQAVHSSDWLSHPRGIPRCEDCGHPMSEGTITGGVPPGESRDMQVVLSALRGGREPHDAWGVHYSPCDEGCRHGANGEAVRWRFDGKPWETADNLHAGDDAGAVAWLRDVREFHDELQVSWRPVDVRCLSWPHDLRPESLAVLCLRCWAARQPL